MHVTKPYPIYYKNFLLGRKNRILFGKENFIWKGKFGKENFIWEANLGCIWEGKFYLGRKNREDLGRKILFGKEI